MSKVKIVFLLLFLLICLINGQNKYSIQAGTGLFYPANYSGGITVLVKGNWYLNNNLASFFSVAVSKWDKNKVHYDLIIPDNLHHYSYLNTDKVLYNETDHKMTSFFAGIKYVSDFQKQFDVFAETETGINFLRYNYYQIKNVDTPDGFIDKTIMQSSAENKNGTFFYIGLGAGVIKEINNIGNISVGYKRGYLFGGSAKAPVGFSSSLIFCFEYFI